MASLNPKPGALAWLWLCLPGAITVGAALALVLVAVTFSLIRPRTRNDVPELWDSIPRVANTFQYMTDTNKFLARAAAELRRKSIIGFFLGPMRVYLVKDARNVQAMFRATNVSTDIFTLRVQRHLAAYSEVDVLKFAADQSGRSKATGAGTENKPRGSRYWATMHQIMADHLSRDHAKDALSTKYQELFGQRLVKFPVGEWTTVHIYEFLRDDMATAATATLVGWRVFEQDPVFIKRLWEFDEVGKSLIWGFPRWLTKTASMKRDELHGACARHLEKAIPEFDWDGPDATADWDPVLGSRFIREYVKWMRDCGFTLQTIGGAVGLGIFGMSGNTTPIVAWCMMEITKDPLLFRQVRDEVTLVCVVDELGNSSIDVDRLMSSPLLQSIYAETLRLHVSINVTRQLTSNITLGEFSLEKGSVIQAATEICHLEEAVWGVPGHPASEFWAERHIKHVQEDDGQWKRQFAMTKKPGEFFPFGGGLGMCPGRFFAKQEVILTIAMLVSMFDIEFEGWTNPADGSPSDRQAQNDARYSGTAAVPPDRDMKVRLRRLR